LALLAVLAGFGAAVFLLSVGAVVLRPEGAEVSVWWPAAAAAVVGVLLAPDHRGRVAAVLVVALATGLANLAASRPPAVAVGFAIANAAEAALVSGLLLRGRRSRPGLVGVDDLSRMLLAAGAGAVLAGGLAAVTVEAAVEGDWWSTWRSVTTSHGSALVLLLPLALRGTRDHGEATARERFAQVLVLLVLLGAAFGPEPPLPVSLLPAMAVFWAALRCGTRTVVLQLLLTGAVVSAATLQGWGPYALVAAQVPDDPLLPGNLVHVFVISMGVMGLGIATTQQDRRAALAQVRRLAFSDSLTGIGNRRAFDALFSDAVERARRGEASLLLLLDLDGFKGVNDAHGHEAGDQVLTEVAERLSGLIREQDTVVRLGGDEFVVLCPGLHQDGDDAHRLQQRIVDAVAEPFRVGRDEASIGVSVGGVQVTPSLSHADHLRAADAAMYRVKGERRREQRRRDGGLG